MKGATGIYRAIYSTVLGGGGWWTATEVTQDLPIKKSVQDTRRLMRDMAVKGYLERRQRKGAVNTEYAVTEDCGVPPGYGLGELMQMAGRV